MVYLGLRKDRHGAVSVFFAFVLRDQCLAGAALSFFSCAPAAGDSSLRARHGSNVLPALSSAQSVAGDQPFASGGERLRGSDLRRWTGPGGYAPAARPAAGKECESHVLCCGPARRAASGDRAPGLGGGTPDRQSHLVASAALLFSHPAAAALGDRARRGVHRASAVSGRAISVPPSACVIPCCVPRFKKQGWSTSPGASGAGIR